MSISIVSADRGTATEKTADQTLTLTPSGNLASGSYGLLCVVVDNPGAAEGETTDITATGGGYTWVRLREQAEANTAAGTGVTCAILMAQLTGGLTTAQDISIAIGTANSTAKAAGLMELAATSGVISLAGANGSNAAAANSYSVELSGLANVSHLYIGMAAAEDEVDAGVTLDTAYTAAFGGAIGSGTAAAAVSNVRALVGTLIATSTGDTFSSSVDTADRATILVALEESIAATPLSYSFADEAGLFLADTVDSVVPVMTPAAPLALNNYLFVRVQDGMSASERIR